MAVIQGGDQGKVFEIQAFLGLNASTDGDTQLRLGEASKMENWRVTPHGHLRIRPGLKTLTAFRGPVRGMWCGTLGRRSEPSVVIAAEGLLWHTTASGLRAFRDGEAAFPMQCIGSIADAEVSFFGFGDRLYILNGRQYLCWDGFGEARAVEGYVPLVVTASPPGGGGTRLEYVNRLTPKRRVRFSPNGVDTVYRLPEQDLASVDRVRVGPMEWSVYTANLAAGTVELDGPVQAGTSTIEIWYSVRESLRAQVEGMRFAETFNGAADTRVFLYGDGTNRTIYSGITESGEPSAEYFPDLCEIAVDSANTPITGLARQYESMMVFKPDGAFSVRYAAVTLEDGSVTAGFYVSAMHKELGNEAPGQVRLVYNAPRTFCAGNVYDWQYARAVQDERQAQMISRRVAPELHRADPRALRAFDNELEQEYYLFLGGGDALVHRYGGEQDAWYKYTGLPVTCAIRDEQDVFFGMADGRLCDFSEAYLNDDGERIPCVWESGNMDFGAAYRRKYSSIIWVSLKPEEHAQVTVTAHTDRRTTYTEKLVPANLATFSHVDFRHFSFVTNRNPRMLRVKLKVKKFAFYKLVLRCAEDNARTTVLRADIRVRYTGFVK